MKNVIYILFLLLCINGLFSQEIEDNRYLTSLLYLKTNQEVNNKVKKYFKRDLKKTKLLKSDYILFNLSNQVRFQSMTDFDESIDYDKYDIDKSLVSNRKLYNKKYGFDSYGKSELFSELIPSNESPLCLVFSKPIDNYLIAEISVGDCSDTGIKRGTVVHLLFLFKNTGAIDQVYIKGFHYN